MHRRHTMSSYHLKLSLKALRRVIEIVGSQYRLAKILGLSAQNISQWMLAQRYIPLKHLPTLIKLSNDTLTMADFRPDIYEKENK